MNSSSSPTLLVLAAGMGSRYGGLKQIDPVGPAGETIIDYSIFDALRAGFGKLVFIIRKEIEQQFREIVGARFEKRVAVEYVFQSLDDIPPRFAVPAGRTKPWGTTQAIMLAANAIHEPFAAINADDFYGADGYRELARHLTSGSPDYAMVGFILRNTLSEFGSVARGVCRVGEGDILESIVELTKVERDGGHARNSAPDGTVTMLTGDEPVSLNMWGFTPRVFDQLRERFEKFLEGNASDLKAECYIPNTVGELVRAGEARVKVLHTRDSWFGVTYREDRPRVIESIRRLVADGLYPRKTLAMTETDLVPRDPRAAATQFRFHGEVAEIAPHGNGHINDTYRVECHATDPPVRYILQHINRNVFRNPAAVMQNIERVTAHLGEQAAREPDAARRVLKLVPALDGRNWHVDAEGETWRAFQFIDGARTYGAATSAGQAFEAARAFGRFQQQLANLPAPRLHDTIPDFHHTPKRFAALEQAIASDVKGRAILARPEIEFALARQPIASVLLEANLPERITHNDTKFNNVLLDDATGEGICVIDLDTVMPGLALYDFGDMVRTTTSPAAEDEQDLSKVAMQFPLFEALVRGYLEAAGGFLTAAEKKYLAFSGKLITFEIGIRFLADHLAGDTYFKIHREGHNLDRCRTQFKLVESIERQEEKMNRLVEMIAA